MTRTIPHLLFALHCVLCGHLYAETPQPNILFILADDWGWGDLGVHGNALVKTPHLDRLAREGTEFYQFNVGSPVCSPSRVAFTTGMFPARFSIHEAIGPPSKNRAANQVDWLTPQAVTLPRLLQSAGYATGHFGKWHLCSRVADAPMPAAYGIDEHALWVGPEGALETDHRKVFDDAVAFLRRHKGEPFYLNLWIKETHLAHDPSEESMAEHAHLDEQQRVYSAVVADGDKGVGKVLAALDELGLADNTLVIFSSDNGPENTGREKAEVIEQDEDGKGRYGHYYSVGSTGGLRGRKRSLYAGGVRLPFIVRWPGQVPPGKVNKTTSLTAVDLLPTICAAAAVSLPAGYQPDGENMLPALLGKEMQRTKPIFWDWRGKDTPADCWPRWAVRDGDWKLVTDAANRRELYHSPDDWAEGRNVASEHPEIAAKLAAQLAAWKATLPKEPAADNISKEGRGKKRVRGKAIERGETRKVEPSAAAEDQLPPQDKRGRTALEPKATTGLVPLNEFTPDQTYKGQTGGLYGEGRNTPPDEHLAAAILAARAIQPLDPNGQPDPDGKKWTPESRHAVDPVS